MAFARRRIAVVVGSLACMPSTAFAANIALEAPIGAPSRNPGESYSVIQGLLEARGHTVTIVDGTQIDTLDEIQQFGAVVLSGSGYQNGHDCAVFDAVIPDYVEQGGGLVVTGWFYYFNNYDNAPGLMDVTPFEPSTGYVQGGVVAITDGHEIVEGLSDWNNPTYDSNNGPIDMGAVELSRNGGVIDGAVMQYGGGRVASLGPLFTAEYEAYQMQALHNGTLPDATEMFLRAIEWTASQQAPEGCHDGDLDVGEECDDGNFVNTDACVNPCVFASCGDGYTQAGVEECDDGDDDNSDGCLVGCVLPSCGDGILSADEPCDDGNDDNTDACVGDMCSLASCGDGYVFAGFEECDDANDQAGDGCTMCQLDSSESSSEGGEEEGSSSGANGEVGETGGTGDDESTGGSNADDDTTGAATMASGGESGGDTGGSSGEGDETSGGIDPSGVSGATAQSLEDRAGGCGCAADEGSRAPWVLVLVALGLRRRRVTRRSVC